MTDKTPIQDVGRKTYVEFELVSKGYVSVNSKPDHGKFFWISEFFSNLVKTTKNWNRNNEKQ